jgi:hypothetical protein
VASPLRYILAQRAAPPFTPRVPTSKVEQGATVDVLSAPLDLMILGLRACGAQPV